MVGDTTNVTNQYFVFFREEELKTNGAMNRVFFVVIHDKKITIHKKNLKNRDLFCSLGVALIPNKTAPKCIPGLRTGVSYLA